MMPSGRCPKCDGAMAEGWIVDQGHGQIFQTTWQAGPPQRGAWFGMLKQSKKDQLRISTRRCDRCGYLESFAPRN